jgi:hypothetical protein
MTTRRPGCGWWPGGPAERFRDFARFTGLSLFNPIDAA